MMYNFGNIVCWRADGSLDSFGRIDDQVKVKVCLGVSLNKDITDDRRVSVSNWTA
jgi:non-ribosomal peptide synthetase component F